MSQYKLQDLKFTPTKYNKNANQNQNNYKQFLKHKEKGNKNLNKIEKIHKWRWISYSKFFVNFDWFFCKFCLESLT